MANSAVPNVWTQMNYVPPRGQCNFKPSIMSAKCPCLRFMLHPLKSSSSYECDGCNHHASFHSMENKSEDEIRKRWESEALEKQEQEKRVTARPRKRLKELEYSGRNASSDGPLPSLAIGPLTPDEMSDEFMSLPGQSQLRGKGKTKSAGSDNGKKAGRSTATRIAATRARERVIQELLDGEDTIELD